MCCAAMFLRACNKDKVTETNTEVVVTQDKDPIEQLRSFRQLIKEVNAHQEARSNETMSLADALWDVENTFNLTYTDAENYHEGITTHEFSLYLPVDESHEVLVTDAVELYSQAVEQARTVLNNSKSEQGEFITLNITGTEEVNGSIRVDFSGKTGERTTYNPHPYHLEGPFGEEDDWMFASPLGKCNDPDIPSGADLQLQEKLFDTLIGILPDPAPGYRNIYVNRVMVEFDGSNAPGIYYNTDTEHLCIASEDMNNHYQSELRMITRTIPEMYHLNNYHPLSIEIIGDYIENQTAVTHRNIIYYGIRLQVSTDEFGEVTAL